MTDLEVRDAVGLHPIRGADVFFDAVPADRRAIVTSGSVPIATARLGARGYERPAVFVTVDDVVNGKPTPRPFRARAERLAWTRRAGSSSKTPRPASPPPAPRACAVIALTGTTAEEELTADLVVDGLDVLRIEATAAGDDATRSGVIARPSDRGLGGVRGDTLRQSTPGWDSFSAIARSGGGCLLWAIRAIPLSRSRRPTSVKLLSPTGHRRSSHEPWTTRPTPAATTWPAASGGGDHLGGTFGQAPSLDSWYPQRLKVELLQPQRRRGDPLGADFDYAAAFATEPRS